MSVLYLCETVEHARQAAADPAGIRVPLSVDAWWAFETDGVPYRTAESMYDEWQFAELRYPVLGTQLQWLQWLNAELRSSVPAVAALELDAASPWLYNLKRLADQIVGLEFVVSAITATASPTEVVSGDAGMSFDWPAFFRRGPYGAMVVPDLSPGPFARMICARDGLAWRPFAATAATAARPRRLRWARRLVHNLPPRWREELDAARGRSVAEAVTQLARRTFGRGDRILVVRGGYDLNPLIAHAIEQGARIHYWTRSRSRVRLSGAQSRMVEGAERDAPAAWARLAGSKIFRSPFTVNGIDACSLIEPGLRYFIERVVPETVEDTLLSTQCLTQFGYKAVLAPAGIREATLLQASRRAGVPVIIYQHGGFVGTCEQLFWDLTDLANADYLLAYGDGAKAYFDKRPALSGVRRARVEVAGSARLERLAERLRPRGRARGPVTRGDAGGVRTVLYVPTKTAGYARPLVADSYPEVGYHRLQRRVIELMRDYPGVSFVYKPFADADDTLIRRMAVQAGVVNCRIERETPVPSLMQSADLVVIDFPSTALLEVALTDTPLVLYADRRSLRLEPEAAVLLRRRASVADTEDGFLAAIREAIDGRAAADPADKEFVQAFALDPRQGSATARAWSLVSGIASRGPSSVAASEDVEDAPDLGIRG